MAAGASPEALISPASDILATISRDSRIRQWDRQGRLLHVLGGERSLFGYSAPLLWAEFSADDRFITTASEDLSPRSRDAATCTTLLDTRSMRLQASGRPDGIAIGMADGSVEIVDGLTLAVRHRVRLAADRLTVLSFDSHGGGW